MSTQAPLWSVFVAAALGGGLVAITIAVLSSDGPTAAPAGSDRLAQLETTVAGLQAEVTTLRRRTPRDADRATASDLSGEVELADGWEELQAAAADDALASLSGEMGKLKLAKSELAGAKSAGAETGSETDIERARIIAAKQAFAREKRAAQLKRQVDEYGDLIGLDDAQRAEVTTVRLASYDEFEQAKAGGASTEVIAEIEQRTQSEFRRIMGETGYREYNRIELDRVAAPIIAKVANSVGVTDEQRQEMERVLSSHIDRVLDQHVRVRSEVLADDSRRRLREDIDLQNQAAWAHLREEVLTDEQRRRVPRSLK